jgi:hypothetical protein
VTAAPVDYAFLAHQAAAKRMRVLEELLDAEPDEADALTARLDPPLAPGVGYCGCGTCDIRETLAAAWPILLDAARAEVAAGR